MKKSLDLAVIPGDGIGPEVTAEALATLQVAAAGKLEISMTEYSLGAAHFLATGEVLSDDTLAKLARHDAILLGAVGGQPNDPRLSGGVIERGLLLKLRFTFDQYVNIRPFVLMPGLDSPLSNPGSIDFVVVREGTEGPYVGNGGSLRGGTDEEIASEVSLNTAFGVERVVRFAFETAMKRRKHLTWVHKTNVLIHAGGLWSRVVSEVHEEFPDVELAYLHIDAATIFMVTDPARFDVVVTDNLFGDILTDLAAAVSGGIGVAASGNLNPAGTYPGMFEPVHGSAPDIAGLGLADPTAAILSVALMAQELGHSGVADAIRGAVGSHLLALPRRRKGSPETGMTLHEIGASVRSKLSVTR